MTKPTDYPDWALVNRLETVKVVVNGQETIQQVPNKVKPDVDKVQNGYLYQNKPAYAHINWMFWNQSMWIRYFDSQLSNLENKRSFTNTTKPAANEAGEGTIIFIKDIDGGVMAYSTGTVWKNLTTGNVI